MEVVVLKNYDELSQKLADEISNYMIKENSVISLPSGDTPIGAYNILVDKFKYNKTKIKTTFVGLDEWIGMDKYTKGSCQNYMYEYLFNPLGIEKNQIIEFNAKSNDLENELAIMDEFISKKGKLDLVVLGIGMNGHLGLNEPGTSFDSYSNISILDDKTKQVGQKYFENNMVLNKGITLGLKHFLEAKKLILVASGSKKYKIVNQILNEDVNENNPASICKLHNNCLLIIDEACRFNI